MQPLLVKNSKLSSYKAALVLMRIPFSVYLMPVFWFALTTTADFSPVKALLVFLIIHFLVYPASNGYNSYHDKDEGSIGGLKQPPKVNQELLHVVVLFDILAISAGFLLSPLFAGMVTTYLLVSKAYSYKGIRLKKYPIISTLVVTFFQGIFAFAMIQVGLEQNISQILQHPNISFALISTLFLCGSYPLTQIYQHTEDNKRGDRTLSLLLGVQGTFIFAAISLATGAALLLGLYFREGQFYHILIFLVSTAPVVYFFTSWALRARTDIQVVNYENTMRMNKLSSVCISFAFILILLIP